VFGVFVVVVGAFVVVVVVVVVEEEGDEVDEDIGEETEAETGEETNEEEDAEEEEAKFARKDWGGIGPFDLGLKTMISSGLEERREVEASRAKEGKEGILEGKS